jgi:hypothetical protein
MRLLFSDVAGLHIYGLDHLCGAQPAFVAVSWQQALPSPVTLSSALPIEPAVGPISSQASVPQPNVPSTYFPHTGEIHVLRIIITTLPIVVHPPEADRGTKALAPLEGTHPPATPQSPPISPTTSPVASPRGSLTEKKVRWGHDRTNRSFWLNQETGSVLLYHHPLCFRHWAVPQDYALPPHRAREGPDRPRQHGSYRLYIIFAISNTNRLLKRVTTIITMLGNDA